jgi:hypothetical protein
MQSPNISLTFSGKKQGQSQRAHQAEPKIKPHDHPTLEYRFDIKGNGQIRGRTRLMLTGTLFCVL